MKHLVAIVLLLCDVCAYCSGNCLIVELRNGEKEAYIMSEKPVMTFGDDMLTIKVAQASFSMPMDDVARYYFDDGYEGAQSLQSESAFSVAYDTERIIINGAESATLYSVGGRMMIQAHQSASEICLPIGQLPSGIYLMKIDNETIKFIKQ